MQKKTKKEGPLYRGTPEVAPALAHTNPGGSAEALAEEGGLTQIRDILLGPMSQTFEQKMNQLEQSVDRSMRDFTEKTSIRIDEMEKRTDDRLVRLREDMKGDRERHSKTAEQLKRECDAAVNAVRESVEKLVKQCERTQADFAEATRAKIEQLSATLSGRLDNEVVDRASLASALSEAALRLSGTVPNVAIDPNAPDPEIDAALANLR